ncbi:hypothetical protein [Gemmata sp.]|uniref:hypothetical protein n=1 Tax=Gemmata sp. TaxID=1914242 RepID=UPI003F6E58E7
MRRRLLLAQCGLVLGVGSAAAQLPPFPQTPVTPATTQPRPPFPQFPQGPVVPASMSPAPGAPVQPAAPVMRTQPPFQPGVALPPGTLPPGFSPPGAVPGATNPPAAFPPALPGQLGQNPNGNPGLGQNLNPIAQPQEVPLPYPEAKTPINVRDLSLKRVSGGWQLWGGFKVLRDFGDRELDARNALRVYKDLRPTEWVTIGTPRPVVEYALVDGKSPVTLGMPGRDDAGGGATTSGPVVTGAGATNIVPIDLRTVRVEAVRGVWCVRDDDNLHFNFGPVRADAEQAVAAIRRYGFNRVGVVGQGVPVMTYLFAGSEEAMPAKADKGPLARVALQAQIDGLTRVGIPVAGVGFVGEMTQVDPRKLDVRKDGGDWVVASGVEVLGRFGPSEWAARDAARAMGDMRVTEFCKVGSGGLTFFLANGKAPTRVPFNLRGRRFDPAALKVQAYGNRFAVTENGRHLFDCATAEEGETLLRVVKSYGFDQLGFIGSGKVGVQFLAKAQ